MPEKLSHRQRPTFQFSNSGERFRPVYELDQATGRFIEKGRIDLKEFINSGFIETDLYSLIDRYKTIEDFNSKGAAGAFYGDVTDLPKNLFEAAEAVKTIEKRLIEEGEKTADGSGTIPPTTPEYTD